ncbi:ImmA/IrrE family metallo-endopeptidase [Anaerotruncus colihominis]|uniref:ImmA/IrrE family metallo-endopeptidase n=2 Tax=Anaerotruncus colihominis TaxID=169435 RepID=A0A845RH31_9FIRM|nr:ImmA/IrrE family metallo-endopeptidase [Anaerotruncus colihominis]
MSFLLEQGISALPVNPCAIPPKNGWMLFSYSTFAARIQESVAYLQTNYDKDGFVLWSEPAQTFVICYNDSAPQNEIRWTVIHEIGHISLHHVSPGCPVLARHGAGNRLYELEAECFALRVLCPAPVLRECGVDTPEEIANMCGIPGRQSSAALAYVRDFSVDSKTAPLLSDLKRQFAGFIESNKKNRLYEQAASRNGGLILWLTIWRIKRNCGTKC